MVKIGIFGIRYSLTSLNDFSEAPREGHLRQLVNIFGYFQHKTGMVKGIVVSPEYIRQNGGRGPSTWTGFKSTPMKNKLYMEA